MASFEGKTISHIHHELHSHLPSEPALRTKALESLLAEKQLIDPAAVDAWIEMYRDEIGPKRAPLSSRAPGAIPPSRRASWPMEPPRSANSASPATRLAISKLSRTRRTFTISSSARSALAIRSRCWVSRPPGTSRTNIALARCAIRVACSRNLASSLTARRRSGSGTSTSERRYLVVPQRPEGVDDWDEAALAGLVTRNSMIGAERDLSPARANA